MKTIAQVLMVAVIGLGMLASCPMSQAQQLLPPERIPATASREVQYYLVAAPEDFASIPPMNRPIVDPIQESDFSEDDQFTSTAAPENFSGASENSATAPENFSGASENSGAAPENLSEEAPLSQPVPEPPPTAPARQSATPSESVVSNMVGDWNCSKVDVPQETRVGGCRDQISFERRPMCIACGTDTSCTACGACNQCQTCNCDQQPWRLFWTSPRGIQTYGWVESGMMVNPSNPASGFNGPVALDDHDSDLMLNQFYLIMERAVEKGIYGWDIGGRIDFLYGSDARVPQSSGWERRPDGTDHWNEPGQTHQLSIPQLYAEISHHNLSMKLGHFYSIVGYESLGAPNKFFYTHSYAFTHAGPFTHFGGMLSWQASERFTFHGGIVNGWNALDRQDDRAAFIGGVNYKPWHEQYTIAYSFISGTEPDRLGGVSPCTKHSLAFAWDINQRWQYVLAHDAGWQENVLGNQAEWYGIANYLFYTIDPCWKAGMRVEWFRDDDGVRVAGFDANNPYVGGSPGNFWEVSLGLNWKPNPNVMLRPELRWDWYDGIGNLPFDDGTSNNQFLAGMDLVLQF